MSGNKKWIFLSQGAQGSLKRHQGASGACTIKDNRAVLRTILLFELRRTSSAPKGISLRFRQETLRTLLKRGCKIISATSFEKIL